ncbi:MAG: hypothetical protein AAB792_01715 [Patescibacteria group bacterium]
MEILLKTICDNAFADQAGKLNIIGIFDEIYAPLIPATHPKMTLVFVVKGTPKKQLNHGFDIEDPSGKKIIDSAQNPNIKPAIAGESGVVNIIHNIVNLKLESYGKYRVNLYAEGLKESLSFDVKPLPKGNA